MDEALALAIGAFVLSFVAAVPAYAKRVECRGDRDCPATVHIHGCFAEGRVIPDRYHGSRAGDRGTGRMMEPTILTFRNDETLRAGDRIQISYEEPIWRVVVHRRVRGAVV
jgi:hypothetical protein